MLIMKKYIAMKYGVLNIIQALYGCVINLRFMVACMLLMCLSLGCAVSISAQETGSGSGRFTVGTNALSWLTLAPNASFDCQVGKKVSLGGNVAYKPWHVLGDNKKVMGISVNPEVKYWFCRPFYKHYLGLAANYADYNGGLNDYRYQGNLWGASVIYGYQLILSSHWNLEFSVGLGYCSMDYDKYYREVCGDFIGHEKKNYVGLAKLGISFIRVF